MNEREPWRNSSCGNSCMFGSPGGMGTNGWCTCLASERDVQKRIRIHRGVLALKDGIRERDEEIAALREDRDRWYSAAGQRQDELNEAHRALEYCTRFIQIERDDNPAHLLAPDFVRRQVRIAKAQYGSTSWAALREEK